MQNAGSRRGTALSNAEVELWHAWKRATDAVVNRIGREIAEATGLSGPDFGILSRLVELGRGTLRQQVLARSLDWHKSRLSHHLSRMEQRDLVRRMPSSANAVHVAITASGRRALRAARPVHASAIRTHLVARVQRVERRQLLAFLGRLSAL